MCKCMVWLTNDGILQPLGFFRDIARAFTYVLHDIDVLLCVGSCVGMKCDGGRSGSHESMAWCKQTHACIQVEEFPVALPDALRVLEFCEGDGNDRLRDRPSRPLTFFQGAR